GWVPHAIERLFVNCSEAQVRPAPEGSSGQALQLRALPESGRLALLADTVGGGESVCGRNRG
ncbi:hypothetical protein EV174_005960, partial [Coemansia sp. RSA 2320]